MTELKHNLDCLKAQIEVDDLCKEYEARISWTLTSSAVLSVLMDIDQD